jgi:hypothetical protein
LGNFHTTGTIINQFLLNIEYELNITYYAANEKSRMNVPYVKLIAPIISMEQPTWIHDVISLKDS